MYLLISCYFMSVWVCVCLCMRVSTKFMWKTVCDLQNQLFSLYHLCFWDIKFSLLGWEQEPFSAKPFNQFWTILNHILGSLFWSTSPCKGKRNGWSNIMRILTCNKRNIKEKMKLKTYQSYVISTNDDFFFLLA